MFLFIYRINICLFKLLLNTNLWNKGSNTIVERKFVWTLFWTFREIVLDCFDWAFVRIYTKHVVNLNLIDKKQTWFTFLKIILFHTKMVFCLEKLSFSAKTWQSFILPYKWREFWFPTDAVSSLSMVFNCCPGQFRFFPAIVWLCGKTNMSLPIYHSWPVLSLSALTY